LSDTPFIITIDTEGDDLWSKPRQITTRNAGYLPRFQSLCERYGFKPVYLTNYEMAMCDAFVEFGRDVAERNAGEIGMHLHAWNSPPLVPLTRDDFRHQPYLTEYPDQVMRDKVRFITHLLQDRFERTVSSHRAGRLGFDGRYAAILLAEGYRVDCSVTPGLDWRPNLGDPAGGGGVDYRSFPDRPYFLAPSDIAAPAASGLLEVPVTIRPSGLYRMASWIYRLPLVRGVANDLAPGLSWMGPVQPTMDAPLERNLETMLNAESAARAGSVSHVEFMMHSSELMPGGNPLFRNASDIERLYDYLEALFERLAAWCRGTTLEEFHARMTTAGA